MKHILTHNTPQYLLIALLIGALSLASPGLGLARAFAETAADPPITTSNPPTTTSNPPITASDPPTTNLLTTTPPSNPSTDPPGLTSSDPPASPLADQPLIIVAVNPGYKLGGISETNELIELQNQTGAPLDLSLYSLRYTNSSGKQIALLDFPPGTTLDGETLLLSYAKSPNASSVHHAYTPSLALTAGPLELLYAGEVVDSVCWTGKNDCAKAFKSADPTTLVRDLETGTFAHLIDYIPPSSSISTLTLPPNPDAAEDLDTEEASPLSAPHCYALEFTELYSYYTTSQSEQFIELYNPTATPVTLDGCALKYKNKLYPLTSNLPADSYFAYYPGSSFSLTKNPTTSNSIFLIDSDGQIATELTYPHGQRQGTSYALFYDASGLASWQPTYSPTPGAANTFQEFRTCPSGKVINPLTGNCVNSTSLGTTTAECPAGKYRNPLTGRCKNLASATSTLSDCAEGYERNPETNRCRKITTDNSGAEYALVPNTNSDDAPKTFIALGLVILLVSAGTIYIILQFRHEIARAYRKLRRRLTSSDTETTRPLLHLRDKISRAHRKLRERANHILQHNFSRRIRRHRDKDT